MKREKGEREGGERKRREACICRSRFSSSWRAIKIEERKRTWLKFFKAISSDLPKRNRNASKRRSLARDWPGNEIFPGMESFDWWIWAIRGRGGEENLLGVFFVIHWGSSSSSSSSQGWNEEEEREILSYNGVHVTPVQPDPTVRRYVARVYVNRGVEGYCRGFIGVSQVERETTLFSFFFFFSPVLRFNPRGDPPVLAGTRFENSGLFKGNYRFYFRSARQFEFLIRKERGSGWVVLGNCAIRTRIREFDFRRGEFCLEEFSPHFFYTEVNGEFLVFQVGCFALQAAQRIYRVLSR